jgi:uncharacterized membrane protein
VPPRPSLPSPPAFLRGRRGLAVILGVSGALHIVVPGIYEGMVPVWLPRRRLLVYVSGLAEIVSAAGLLVDAGWAGALSAATLVGVWPANVQMAVEATRAGRPLAMQAGLWARVPMQVPMIRTALRSGPVQM